jgi:hypothetical protein
MRTRIGAVLALVIGLSLPVGAALARRMGGHAYPKRVHTYTGSDSAGTVSFGLFRTPPDEATAYAVRNFQFATSCSTTPITIATMAVNSKYRFGYNQGGIVVSAKLASNFAQSSGALRVTTSSCSSGPLRFIAKPVAAP